MNCPICQVALLMTERQGIEIDYCPQCRGIWLDRGELDKLIERSSTVAAAAPRPVPQPQAPSYPTPSRHGDEGYRDSYGYKKKKPKSFLGELFDFD
jgi:Zn-finger nucleic acid-binding protein